MKQLLLLLTLVILSTSAFSQTYKDAMSFGFGASSPRMFGDVYSENMNFGAHAFVQKDFDETNSLRIKLDYLNFTSTNPSSLNVTPAMLKAPSTNSVVLSFDYLNTLTPCKPLKLYIGTGISVLSFKVTNGSALVGTKNILGEISFNFIAGARLAMNSNWDVRGEFAMHQLSTDRFDGVVGPNGGLFGGTLDSYISAEFSAMYFFDRGTETKYCESPGGITNIYNNSTTTNGAPVVAGANAAVDYDRIQRMIDASKNVPAVVDYKKIDDLIAARLEKMPKNNGAGGATALVGINFDLNDATIKSENYAILAQDASILLANTYLNVEIQGFTDKDGNSKSNLALSEKRANNVKNYLVAKGVSASRLTVKSLGEATPVSENKSYNRRVELVIVK